MSMRRLLSTLTVCSLLFAVFTPAQEKAQQKPVDPAKALEGFDEFVNQTIKDWHGAGAAVAIVQGDKVVLLKGYGYRDVEKKLAMTPKSLCAIASITKSFTVTDLGMLFDEGKGGWDVPVRSLFPAFKMYDPVLTEQMVMRDLVTHRSGLPRHDMVWYSSDFSRDDLIRRLQYLEPNKALRTTFQYNNLMFMTAGYVAGILDSKKWEDSLRARVLTPLGMNTTTFSLKELQASPDFALPYQKGRDLKAELKRMPFEETCPDTCALGPAGELNSNAEDMSHYLLFHLNHGNYNGKQLLSENNSSQMQTPQMTLAGAPDYPELGENSYGMGFFISTYRGRKRIEHGGNLDGFSSIFTFLPNEKIGVVVLTNLDGSPLPDVIAFNAIDRLLGLDQVPWSKRMLDSEIAGRQSEADAKSKGYDLRKKGTHPSHDIKDYLGDYENPGYGIVSVAEEKEGLLVKLNKLSLHMKHYHYDVFEVPFDPQDPFAKQKLSFFGDLNGDISSLSMPLEPRVKDIVFTRMPDKQLTDHTFLQALVGQYDFPGDPTPTTVALRGDHTLVMSQPGAPERELIPRRGTTFDLKGLEGFSIEFKRDASGRVTEAVFYTPDTTVIVKRK
jgi:CubicO group peptidase (beta-lactamase class C family)